MTFVFCSKPTSPPKSVIHGEPTALSPMATRVDPHTPQFKTTFIHGAAYFKEPGTCQKCHLLQSSVGWGTQTACTQCHTYPHPPNWTLPNNHGEAYVRDSSHCLNCHAVKSAFHIRHPSAFVSCGDCHPTVPHAEGFHGKGHADLAKTYEGKCTLCHTHLEKYLPSYPGQGCKFCHEKDETPVMKFRVP